LRLLVMTFERDSCRTNRLEKLIKMTISVIFYHDTGQNKSNAAVSKSDKVIGFTKELVINAAVF
jgi:hypothetical protein